MGMDVYGNEPKNEAGQYFRANVWYWRPLWTFACQVGNLDEKTAEGGTHNSGNGLNAGEAYRLGRLLKTSVQTGEALAHEKTVKEQQDSAPDDPCSHCKGTGKNVYIEGADKCNGCDGTGKVRPFFCHYPFDVATVEEFAEFCEQSGGFKIW